MARPIIQTELPDEELVAIIVATNNTNSFAVLYDRYSQVVYNKCLSFAKSKEEAEDLTHDIFVLLFAKLKTFKGRSKFSTWLYSFVYNFCVNYIQRTQKKKNEKFLPTDDITRYAKEEVTDEQIFELKSELLQKALRKIDSEDRMVLLMKYQDEMTIKEMMDSLDLGSSAVKMRLNRAKKKLLNIYKGL